MSPPREARGAGAPAARTALQVALVNGGLALAGVLLLAGFFSPLLTVRRLLLFADDVTLLSALGALAKERELPLFALLLAFSVLFPIAKLASLAWAWNRAGSDSERTRRALGWMALLGKWSMLDVFVVALMVVSVKLRWIADVQVRYGLYLFGASVLLTMALGGLIARLAGGEGGPPGDDLSRRWNGP